MTLARVHADEPLRPGDTVELPRDRAHYVSRVLRLGPEDPLNLFNERDGEFTGRIVEARGARVSVLVEAPLETQTESPLKATLVQGLCRSARMDYCVQKASEVGVVRIVPLITERCVVRLDERRAAKRVEHWQAVAISACEQSGRTQAPIIEMPLRFDELLRRDDLAAPALLDPDDGKRYAQWQLDGDALSLMVGPEGGFTPDETARLIEFGAARWRMGPRVLRTETAGVVALALAQAKWGDLG